MPVPTIFLINEQGAFVEMCDQPYDSESLLQQLIAKYPNVLAGDQMAADVPVKWLLVSREAGIPGEEAGGDRWAVDHVFIDQSGVPTLVEVKRSTDTRIRREVVGQLLDYAANAVVYWPVEIIRRRFESTCEDNGLEPEMVVAEFIGIDRAVETEGEINRFWEKVETNLRAGKIRLIFAADEIPPELKRIVEFLNGQMNPAEVLALEIRQYVGPGFRTLVPSVIGSTSKRVTTSGAKLPGIQWDRDSFLAALSERKGAETALIAAKILEWAPAHCPRIWWGEGRKDGSCFVGIATIQGTNHFPFAMWTNGRIEVQFQWLRQRSVSEDLRQGLAARLNAIQGVVIPEDALSRRPSFDMSALKGPQPLAQFFDAIEWFVEQVS